MTTREMNKLSHQAYNGEDRRLILQCTVAMFSSSYLPWTTVFQAGILCYWQTKCAVHKLLAYRDAGPVYITNGENPQISNRAVRK